MKSYNEIAEELLERRDNYVTEKKKRRKVVLSTVSCFCIVAILGFGMWKNGNLNNTPVTKPESTTDNIAGTTEKTTTKKITQEADERRKWCFYVNEIVSVEKGTPRYFDPTLYYTETHSVKETEEYFGVDLTAIPNPPIGYPSANLKYSGNKTFTVTKAKDGTVAEDFAVFRYTDDENKELTVYASKIGAPHNNVYLFESEKTTLIKLHSLELVPLIVGGMKTDENAEFDNFYVVDFEYGEITYRIEAENLTGGEIDAFIREIAKLNNA